MLEADGQWNDPLTVDNPQQNVKTYRRHFVWMGKYAVVFDRLRTKVAAWSKYRLRALTEPVVTGNTVSQLSINGKHKLLQRTLEPSTVIIHKLDETNLWNNREDWIVNASERKWQTVIDLPISTEVNVLNVIQMGDSTMNSFDTLEHIKTPNSSGVRIGEWVVVFASKEVLRSTVTYTINNPTQKTKHLITDLEEGNYQVLVNGAITQMVSVQKNDNTAFFETSLAAGTNNISVSIIKTAIKYNLDIDGDGKTKPLTDGLLLIRYLFGFRNNTLINNALGSAATRTTAIKIQNYIQTGVDSKAWDIDGDGSIKPLTDGLLVIRYMFGFTGNVLTNNAVDSSATRKTVSEIEAYLKSIMP